MAFPWGAPGSWTNALTTELNNLADSGASAASSAISNDGASERTRFMALGLYLASLTPTGTPRIEVHALYSDDLGTDFSDRTANNLIYVFRFSTATATKRIVSALPIPLLPHDFKLQIVNEAGVALPASGNILAYSMFDGTAT